MTASPSAVTRTGHRTRLTGPSTTNPRASGRPCLLPSVAGAQWQMDRREGARLVDVLGAHALEGQKARAHREQAIEQLRVRKRVEVYYFRPQLQQAITAGVTLSGRATLAGLQQ